MSVLDAIKKRALLAGEIKLLVDGREEEKLLAKLNEAALSGETDLESEVLGILEQACREDKEAFWIQKVLESSQLANREYLLQLLAMPDAPGTEKREMEGYLTGMLQTPPVLPDPTFQAKFYGKCVRLAIRSGNNTLLQTYLDILSGIGGKACDEHHKIAGDPLN